MSDHEPPQSPETGSPPEPALTDAQRLAAQFELEDSSYDPVLDAVNPGAQAPSPERTRHPDGTFAKIGASAAAPPSPPAAITHPSYLQKQALDLGLSAEQIRHTPSDQLGELVYHLSRQALSFQRSTSPPAPSHGAASASRPDTSEPPPEDLDFGVDEDGQKRAGYDPGLVRVLSQLQREVKTLRAERQQQQVVSELDKAFAEHADLVGSGLASQLAPGTAAYARVMALIGVARADNQPGSIADKIRRARALLYGSKDPAPAQAPTATPPADAWENAGLVRPSQRAAPAEPKGERRAARAIAAKFKERGWNEDDFANLEEAGLPD